MAWAEYVPDATKTAEENIALKTAHDATKPATAAAPAAAPAAAALTPVVFKDHIKLPDGATIPDEDRAAFEAILNDHTLSRAAMAQKLVDLQLKGINDLSERGKTRVTEMQADWINKTKSDPVIGGDKLPATLAGIGTLLDSYPKNEEVRAALDLTGAGNHPAIVGLLSWVASKINEGGPAPTPVPANPDDAANRMFPSMKPAA